MTAHIDKMTQAWQEYERITLHDPRVPPQARLVQKHAFHHGAFAMLQALHAAQPRNQQELITMLQQLEQFCRGAIQAVADTQQPKGPVQ